VYKLRPYQECAIKSLDTYDGKYPIICIPTGGGKSLILSEICRINKDKTILVVTHRKELIKQNRDEFELLSKEKAGICSSGLKEWDLSKRVTFAGVQTIVNRLENLFFHIILVDECHLIPKSSNTQYGRVIRYIYNKNKDVSVIGLTATPYRLDSGLLYGEDMLFDGVAYEADVYDLIQGGYLSNIKCKRGSKKIDLSKVKKTSGEFNFKDLERSASTQECLDSVVYEVIEELKERKSCIIFSSGIHHSELLKKTFNDNGLFDCDFISSKMSNFDRDQVIEKFKSGEYRVIINTNILTTGFNHKPIDIVVIARATLSASLYVQMVGRGMRVSEGKEDCLILDYGDNVIRHGSINDIQVQPGRSSAEKEKRETKECPHCSYIIPIDADICRYCGKEPVKEKEFKLKHNDSSYDGDILSDPKRKVWLDVSFMYPPRRIKTRKGKDCLLLSYKIKGRSKIINKYLMWDTPKTRGYLSSWLNKCYGIRYIGKVENLSKIIKSKPIPKKIMVKGLSSKFPEILAMRN